MVRKDIPFSRPLFRWSVPLLLFLLSAPLLHAQYTPGAWPASFIDYTDSTGAYIQDVNDQTPLETDIIYSATTPSSVSVNTDGTHAFFRVQLSANPYKANGQWSQYSWVVAIGDSTGQGAPIGWVSVNVSNNMTVEVKDQTTTDVIYTYDKKLANPAAVRSTAAGSSGFYFLDFQVPMAALSSRLGIDANTKVRFYYGSSSSGGTINKDYMTTGDTLSFIGLATTNFNAIETGNLTPLPVELTSFAAYLRAGTAELQWGTATELNNYGFEVQRAVNDGAWLPRGFVTGGGTVNTPRQYRWSEDVSRLHGVIRYRLRQIDRDGTEEIHGMVTLSASPSGDEGIASMYPQPATGSVTVSYRGSGVEAATLSLFDLSGRLLQQHRSDVANSSWETRVLDVSALGPGSYILQLQKNGQKFSQRMVIAR
ncbi:T9SS type A sorting domain-containing protein [bacterium]|nr:T9SS type A sorting domain-containing protein [bacterium]